MKIQIKLLSPKAKIPTHGSPFSAGYDLWTTEQYELKPGERHLFKTDISVAMPDGVYGRIAPRSGLAFKQGIDVMAGVIDSDYRDAIGVILINLSDKPVTFPVLKDGKETPIAQIIFENHNAAEFEQTDTLPQSVRGTGGFGHTDTKPVAHVQVMAPGTKVDLLDKYKHLGEQPSPRKYETVIKEREKAMEPK